MHEATPRPEAPQWRGTNPIGVLKKSAIGNTEMPFTSPDVVQKQITVRMHYLVAQAV